MPTHTHPRHTNPPPPQHPACLPRENRTVHTAIRFDTKQGERTTKHAKNGHRTRPWWRRHTTHERARK